MLPVWRNLYLFVAALLFSLLRVCVCGALRCASGNGFTVGANESPHDARWTFKFVPTSGAYRSIEMDLVPKGGFRDVVNFDVNTLIITPQGMDLKTTIYRQLTVGRVVTRIRAKCITILEKPRNRRDGERVTKMLARGWTFSNLDPSNPHY